MSTSSSPPWGPFPPRRFRPFYVLPGTQVGAFVVREAIGQGGGQAAYLAEGSDGQRVVLKMSLYPAGPDGSAARQQHERFLRQVDFLLQLGRVPGVAHVYAHGMYPDTSESGYAYLVQEWVKGSVNVLDWYGAEPRPLKALVAGWQLLANACAEMHGRGICHRDLKPDNILIKPLGDGIPTLVDFDSAFFVAGEPLTTTGAGRWPGTRRYYSPEVATAILRDLETWERNPYQYRPPSDIWALGVVLYEALTGKYPFHEGQESDELLQSIAHDRPVRPRFLNPAIPFGMDKLVMRLLHKDPAKRPEADELRAELESLLETADDWEQPFQTPARAGQDSGTSHTESTSRPPTPRLSYWGGFRDSSAWKAAPTAIVLAPPRALAVRGPRTLVRLEPAPISLVAVPRIEDSRPTPRRQPWAQPRAFLLVALLALALSGSFLEKGRMLLGWAKVAVIAAASAALSACPTLTGRVRADDRAWLETKCPAEARKAGQELALAKPWGGANLEPGPNVIEHEYGTEVRDGPVEVAALLSTTEKGIPVRLFGQIRTGVDGASIHLDRLKHEIGGHESPICAIVWVRGHQDSPGIPKREVAPFPPASELHPGYMLVNPLAALMVEIAM